MKNVGLRLLLAALLAGFIMPQAARADLASDFSAALNSAADSCDATEANSTSCAYGAVAPRTDFQMRWAAPEEVLSFSSDAREASSGKLKDINERLDKLRNDAAIARILNGEGSAEQLVAATKGQARGGAASADTDSSISADAGFFMSVSYDDLTRKSTSFQDRLKDRGESLLAGFDHRFGVNLVLGVAANYVSKHTRITNDFSGDDGTGTTLTDATNASGKANEKGGGVAAYLQYEQNGFYGTASLGWQRLSQDLSRAVLLSGFSDPPPVQTATSSTHSTALIGSGGFGYAFEKGSNILSLNVLGSYQHQKMASFAEKGASFNVADTATNCNLAESPDCLDLDVHFDAATFESLEGSAGVKLQHIANLSWGVVVPYFSADYIHQFKDQSGAVSGIFVPLYSLAGVNHFTMTPDAPDLNYYRVGIGASAVTKNGWQSFAQLRSTFGLTSVTEWVVSAGFRKEF